MKNYFKFLAACAVAVCFAFALPKNNDKLVVVIDAGHGGKDYGASFEGFMEKNINAGVAQKVKGLVDAEEVEIHFTREGDEFVSLEDRVKTINAVKPDLVLSLHVNFEARNQAYGMEFFVNEKGNYRAVELENKLVKSSGYKSRGIKDAPFYILRKSEAPVVNFQMGFLSHESDRAYLTSEAKQQELAQTIANYLNDIN